MIAKVFAGMIADNIGKKVCLFMGLLLAAFSSIMVARLPEQSVHIVGLAVSYGIGTGLILTSVSAIVARSVSAQCTGLAFGIAGAMRNFSKIFGPVFVGLTLAQGYEFGAIFGFLGSILAAFAIVSGFALKE